MNGGTITAPNNQVIPIAGFTGTVNFACSGLPRGASCAFSPASVAANGTTSVAISTTKAAVVRAPGQVAQLKPFRRQSSERTILLAFGTVLPFALAKRQRQRLLGAALICMLPLLFSCSGATAPGGGGGTGSLPVPSAVTIAASALTPAENASVTITASVSGYGGSAAPSGTLSFFTDSDTTGTSTPITSSGASYTTSFSTPGVHTISAKYSGDSNYQASTSNSLRLNVQYASGTAPGQYTVTVTGTSGSLSSSMNFYLTVQ